MRGRARGPRCKSFATPFRTQAPIGSAADPMPPAHTQQHLVAVLLLLLPLLLLQRCPHTHVYDASAHRGKMQETHLHELDGSAQRQLPCQATAAAAAAMAMRAAAEGHVCAQSIDDLQKRRAKAGGRIPRAFDIPGGRLLELGACTHMQGARSCMAVQPQPGAHIQPGQPTSRRPYRFMCVQRNSTPPNRHALRFHATYSLLEVGKGAGRACGFWGVH